MNGDDEMKENIQKAINQIRPNLQADGEMLSWLTSRMTALSRLSCWGPAWLSHVADDPEMGIENI